MISVVYGSLLVLPAKDNILRARGRIAPHLQTPTDWGVFQAFQRILHFDHQNIQYDLAPKWGAMPPLSGSLTSVIVVV